MSDTSTIRWFDLMREFYGVNLTADRAVTWLRLLKEPDAVTDTDEDEICNVLRWVRKKRENDGYKTKPNLEALIMWIRWYRKEHNWRNKEGAPEEQTCGICHHGWITWYKEAGETPYPPDLYMFHGVDVPCMCSAGVVNLARYDQDQHREIEDRARLGIKQSAFENEWWKKGAA